MIEQIRYFHSLVRLGTFTAAAKEHDITQSAISQQMKALENKLQVVLINKSRHGLTLTEAGQYFYTKTLPIINQLDAVCAETHKIYDNREKIVRFGIPNGYESNEFSAALEKHSKMFPNVKIDIIEGNMKILMDMMNRGVIDFLLYSKIRPSYNNLILFPLKIHEYYVLVPESSDLFDEEFIEIKDFDKTSLIIYDEDKHIAEQNRRLFSMFKERGRVTVVETSQAAEKMLLDGNCYMPFAGSCSINNPKIRKLKLRNNGLILHSCTGVLMKSGKKSKYVNDFILTLYDVFVK